MIAKIKRIKENKNVKKIFQRDLELLYKIQRFKKRMLRKKNESHYSGYKKYVEGVDE